MTGRSFAPDPKGRAAASWTVAAVAIAVARSALGDEPPEVEVRGNRIASPPKEPSVAGSVIREERLRSPGLQAGDVLRTQPGVTVLETGGYGSPSTASIRGATSAQTPVYLAGIRLNDDVGGTADLSLVPLWLLHRVEIYRSNAPLAGDQLGIGGAIFFEPRRPRRAEVDAGVLGGSFGAHAAWALAALGDDASSGLVGIRVDGAQNDYPFVDDGGTRFEPGNSRIVRLGNADQRTADAWAIGSARVGAGGRLDVVVNAVDRDAGLPGLPLFPSTRARVAIQRQLGGLTNLDSVRSAGLRSDEHHRRGREPRSVRRPASRSGLGHDAGRSRRDAGRGGSASSTVRVGPSHIDAGFSRIGRASGDRRGECGVRASAACFFARSRARRVDGERSRHAPRARKRGV